jgi:hypothetical protein
MSTARPQYLTLENQLRRDESWDAINRFNPDGHQFHQYRKSEQLPLILTELTEHKTTTTCGFGNTVHGLGQAQQCGRIKPVYGIPTFISS